MSENAGLTFEEFAGNSGIGDAVTDVSKLDGNMWKGPLVLLLKV